MLEATIRRIHRNVGIYLVGFLALQAFTGLCISLGGLMGTPDDSLWLKTVAWIHTNWDPVGSVYRIILGTLVIGQGIGGLAIYLKMRSRLVKS